MPGTRLPSAASTSTTPAPVATTATRPSIGRRLALGATAFLSCALPTVWGIGTAVELLTGTEADHRFHQVTGQGLLLSAVWLAGLVPLLIAGWRGRTPSTATALHAWAVALAALVAGVLAPGAGALPVAIVTCVSTGLLWLALPVRPRLRPLAADLDPLITPVVLLTSSLLVPFVLGQVGRQNQVHDEHAQLAHYFDMAWVSLALVLLGLLAALSPVARRLALWTTVGTAVVGASRLAFTANTTWSLLALLLGILGTAVVLVRPRRR
jgi:hypothetical protein